MQDFLLLCITLFGAALGSFIGMLIYRLPLEISLLKSSFCANCNKDILFYHNVPVMGYIFLKGRCGHCKMPIGIRYWLIEVVFLVVTWAFYKKYGLSFTFIHHLIAFSVLVVISYIDLDTLFIPNILLMILILLGLIGAFYLKTPPWGAIFGFLFIALLNITATFIYRKFKKIENNDWAMGWGDAWLTLGIGLIVGFPNIFFVIFLAACLGSLVGLIKKLDVIPFGAFLSLLGILFLNFS